MEETLKDLSLPGFRNVVRKLIFDALVDKDDFDSKLFLIKI